MPMGRSCRLLSMFGIILAYWRIRGPNNILSVALVQRISRVLFVNQPIRGNFFFTWQSLHSPNQIYDQLVNYMSITIIHQTKAPVTNKLNIILYHFLLIATNSKATQQPETRSIYKIVSYPVYLSTVGCLYSILLEKV